MSKSCKRSLSKGKLAEKASMEELKPLLSLERPDAASSSSALATPSGVNVAAERASGEQTEGPAEEILSFGTINVKDPDPCDDPNSTGHSNEALPLDPEVLEAALSRNGVWVGEHFCPDRVGFRKLKEEAKVNSLKRLPVTEDGEINSERPGSDSGYWKKECDGLKKESEVLDTKLQLRETLSRFNKTEEGKIMDERLKEEVRKLPAARREKLDMIIDKVSYSNCARTMISQEANMSQKSKFSSRDWREENRFPNVRNGDADYKFWEENFDPETLKRRLAILREAAKNLDPDFDMFMILELVSKLNLKLHPQPRENGCNETYKARMSKLLALCFPDGNCKI